MTVFKDYLLSLVHLQNCTLVNTYTWHRF